jgi:hypothetical protein
MYTLTRTSGGDPRRGRVRPGTGGCPTRHGLDSGHRQCAWHGRRSTKVKVVADEAIGGEWGTDSGGFWAVSSRLRRSGSISTKQSRARQGGRSAEVEEVGADLRHHAGRRSAIGDDGDSDGTSAARTEISVRLRRCHFLNSCAA